MMISTERLLTDRAGFGITTASPAQRAICRIIDGRPLGDLAPHPHVLELIGGADALAALPSERGIMPTECVVLAAIRSAKTIIACAAAIRMTQAIDVSRLGPGEIPRVSIVSLKLDTSAVAHRILAETLRASQLLAALLIADTADVITLRHPSGRAIEIAIVAGAKAGAGLVARWSAGVVFDEAPRMTGADEGIVNLEHARSAVLGRLLPGAQVVYVGSPWAPHGPIYELVQENYGKPTNNIVVLRGTGPQLNPSWWTPARCAKLESQDPVAHQTDVLGEFADPESGLLNPAAVHRNTRESPAELLPEPGAIYVAAGDPAGGGAGGNAWTFVLMQVIERATLTDVQRYRVVLAREWRGLRPEEIWAEISAVCARYEINSAWSDQYAASANQDLARRYGLSLQIETTTATSKLEMFSNLATLIHSDAIELPPDRQFRRDLLSVRKRTTQSGSTIVLPKTGDGRHADYAPAFALALAHATNMSHRSDMTLHRSGGRWVDMSAPSGMNHRGLATPTESDMARSMLRARSASALARLRSLLLLSVAASPSEIADAVERTVQAEDSDAISDTLTRITGLVDRTAAIDMLRSGRTYPRSAA